MSAPSPKSTGQLDKNKVHIFLWDSVRKFNSVGDFFEGVVVFANGAYRIHIKKGYRGEVVEGSDCLLHNYSLLYDEVRGTSNIEVLKPKSKRG